jgi:hypothetical protein
MSTTTTTSVPEQLRTLLKETKARQVLPQTWDLLHVNSTDTVGAAFHVHTPRTPLPSTRYNNLILHPNSH